MKKILSVMLVAVCILLSACSGSKNEKMQFQSPDVIDGYEAAEYEKYDASANKNGLGGTKIYIDGTFESFSAGADNRGIKIILDENEKDWLIMSSLEQGWDLNALKVFKGQKVRLFGVYNGYSPLNMPVVHCIKFTLTDTGESHHIMEFSPSTSSIFEEYIAGKVEAGNIVNSAAQ